MNPSISAWTSSSSDMCRTNHRNPRALGRLPMVVIEGRCEIGHPTELDVESETVMVAV